MENVMIDLETLGQGAGCSILSIGAVAFDPRTHTLGPKFYVVINRSSCIDAGLREDQSTIDWWSQQSIEAKKILEEVEGVNAVPLKEALTLFSNYMNQFGSKYVKLWGNGSDFDNAIMAYTYKLIGIEQPWKFWNNRCYRTLKSLNPKIGFQRTGTYHNALDDAISQATHLCDMKIEGL